MERIHIKLSENLNVLRIWNKNSLTKKTIEKLLSLIKIKRRKEEGLGDPWTNVFVTANLEVLDNFKGFKQIRGFLPSNSKYKVEEISNKF